MDGHYSDSMLLAAFDCFGRNLRDKNYHGNFITLFGIIYKLGLFVHLLFFYVASNLIKLDNLING